MKFTELEIAGAYLVELEPIADERGFFARAFCSREFEEHGLKFNIVQTNDSFNYRKGTLRGLHYQRPPLLEAKLLRCISGAVYDVIADVRTDSPTFMKWTGVKLEASSRRMVLCPGGCAHGYQAIEDRSEVLYHVTHEYVRGAETGIRFDDPAFGISWPISTAIVSAKDRSWPDFRAPA
jgi:dTDP-4-dehydrorhamnose 3,5-epimerase